MLDTSSAFICPWGKEVAECSWSSVGQSRQTLLRPTGGRMIEFLGLTSFDPLVPVL